MWKGMVSYSSGIEHYTHTHTHTKASELYIIPHTRIVNNKGTSYLHIWLHIATSGTCESV